MTRLKPLITLAQAHPNWTRVLVFLCGIGLGVGLALQRPAIAAAPQTLPILQPAQPVGLPEWAGQPRVPAIFRLADLPTYKPERPRFAIMPYTIQEGDTAWAIAERFDLRMESILWGNEGMSANPGALQVGQEINILPVDGVLHTVKEGETWVEIEFQHGTPRTAIIEFLGNGLNEQSDPQPVPGQRLIIPGGTNPVVWIDPGPPVLAEKGRSSPGFYSGPLVYMGTGTYILPVSPVKISQPFWGGHPALDFDTFTGQPIYAADNGTVIYSGWSESGYGNLIIVDHGTGYWTYYAHNDVNLVESGQGVLQGQQIALSGNTGNSSGDHLDFRIRIAGRNFIDPTPFLPLP